MQSHVFWLAAVIALTVSIPSPATAEDPPAPRERTYKIIGDVQLQMTIYDPVGLKLSDKRPAIVFFFGGGWKSGSVKQFENQCKYLASRGMVAMAADYRVSSRHPVKVVDCVADAKSAIRWARYNAKNLGIDPDRIAAGGGSAGGHLAAATATLLDLDSKGAASEEDVRRFIFTQNSIGGGDVKGTDSRPNALLLFNPALDLSPAAFNADANDARARQKRAGRLGADPKALSPTQHIAKGMPPTIIFHGKADTTVPYSQAEKFAKAMIEASNRCELAGYDGQGHGFFNHGRGDNSNYLSTLRKADEFLTSLGYLKGPPTIEGVK